MSDHPAYYLDSRTPGVDPGEVYHAWEHLVSSAHCITGSAENVSGFGMFIQLVDAHGSVWTLTVVPTDEHYAASLERINEELAEAEAKAEKKAKKSNKKPKGTK